MNNKSRIEKLCKEAKKKKSPQFKQWSIYWEKDLSQAQLKLCENKMTKPRKI